MTQYELQQQIKRIGLSEKAAHIYAAILDVGIAFPAQIAQKTKLNRSTVYKILTDLSVKGLVTELERNKKLCYQAERPQRLVRFAQTQIILAEERLEHAKKLLPDVEALFINTPHKPRVRFFEGLKGVLTVYEDHITETEPYEMLGYSNVEELMKILPSTFAKRYVKAKERIGITTRGIFPEGEFSARYNKAIYRGAAKRTLVHMRYIPARDFPYQGEVTLYGKNKVSFINFHERILIGVIIEDEIIAGMIRMMFDLAWKTAKESTNR